MSGKMSTYTEGIDGKKQGTGKNRMKGDRRVSSGCIKSQIN
jgi:hypothetical protein